MPTLFSGYEYSSHLLYYKDLYKDASEALDILSNHVRSHKTSLLLWLVYICTIVSRGDWLGNPANFKGTFYCFGFDVETYHHVTMTLLSLF